jgi:multiple sugar transport system permease protein
MPSVLTFQNFDKILFNSQFPMYLTNSLIVATAVTIITVIAATLAGYGLTRINIYGKKTIAKLLLFSYMFPPMILVIPQFIIWHKLNLINSYLGITLAQIAIALPFSTWLMWKFFLTIPLAMEESAWVSGASNFQAFYEIALPQAKPGIVAVAIFAFAVSWDDYTIANILLPVPNHQTLPPGIYNTFMQGLAVSWGEIMAASVFLIVPGFIFVYFLQKYLLEGFQIGQMK